MIYATIFFGPFVGKPTSLCSRMRLRNKEELANLCWLVAGRGATPRPAPGTPTARAPPQRPRSPRGLPRSAERPLTDAGSARQRSRARTKADEPGSSAVTRAWGVFGSGLDGPPSRGLGWRARGSHGVPVCACCNVGDREGSRGPRGRRAWDRVARISCTDIVRPLV